MMQVVVGYPPNFAAISAAFPQARNTGVLFAYGEIVYNPSGVVIPPQLIAHEGVHEIQQVATGGPSKWWTSYIDDAMFRLAQELPAHQAEFAHYCRRVKDRNLQAKMLHGIASRLSGPLYENVISFNEARRRIAK